MIFPTRPQYTCSWRVRWDLRFCSVSKRIRCRRSRPICWIRCRGPEPTGLLSNFSSESVTQRCHRTSLNTPVSDTSCVQFLRSNFASPGYSLWLTEPVLNIVTKSRPLSELGSIAIRGPPCSDSWPSIYRVGLGSFGVT